MMLTPEQLAELRRLANKAVPSAEWFLSQHLNEVPFIDGAAAKFIVAANPDAILRMLSMLNAQQARIAELEKDAARYRWLRDHEDPESIEGPARDMARAMLIDSRKTDEAIDAAMQPTWPEDASDYGSRIAAIGQNGNDGLHYAREQEVGKDASA